MAGAGWGRLLSVVSDAVNLDHGQREEGKPDMTGDQKPGAKKKSQFTFTDWLEGAVLLVMAVAFVAWLVDK
jgi:hypothetical protein